MRALDTHSELERPTRTETDNVRLIARLQSARRLAAEADDPRLRDPAVTFRLGALDRFSTVTPERVGLTVEPQSDGSLVIEPDLGSGVDRSLLSSRWGQLDRQRTGASGSTGSSVGETAGGAVLRADETLVLLDPEVLSAVAAVRERPLIPAGEVDQFLQAPGSYFDPELVDLDLGFSVRVAGLGVIAPLSFAQASASGLDWFTAQSSVAGPEALIGAATLRDEQDAIEQSVAQAWEHDETVVAVAERLVDVSDHSRVDDALAASRRRLAGLAVEEASTPDSGPDASSPQVTVGMHIYEAFDRADALRARALSAAAPVSVDYETLSRRPFPHQEVGIAWMTGMMHSALTSDADDPARIQGALLADDMGLGKTYMTLVALGEAQRAQKLGGQQALPTLAVMPVALLENWLEELVQTFGTDHGPFDDVVVLQGRGLDDYRMRGATRETAARLKDLDGDGMVRADRIHVALRVGSQWGEARLDRPGVLVLTTYETLRRYQVSLGIVDWGVVVFDEAQATKNPETLATRAAKGLKARFKLFGDRHAGRELTARLLVSDRHGSARAARHLGSVPGSVGESDGVEPRRRTSATRQRAANSRR